MKNKLQFPSLNKTTGKDSTIQRTSPTSRGTINICCRKHIYDILLMQAIFSLYNKKVLRGINRNPLWHRSGGRKKMDRREKKLQRSLRFVAFFARNNVISFSPRRHNERGSKNCSNLYKYWRMIIKKFWLTAMPR